MAQTESAPPEPTRTDVSIGAVVVDSRTGERRKIIYADDRTVLLRDQTGATTLTPRPTFETELGTRYRLRPDETARIDGGQYERLRDRLAEYTAQDGRKAQHKADALRDAVDLLGGRADDAAGTSKNDGADREVPFEEIDGIGPETAGNLRSQGLVTAADVERASDDVLASVSGVGPGTVAAIRSYLA